MQWKIASESALLSRTWNGEYVVYHPQAGDTHLLGEAAVQVLARLTRAPAGWPDLNDIVSQYCDAQDGPDLPARAALTDVILADLETLRLIETSPV